MKSFILSSFFTLITLWSITQSVVLNLSVSNSNPQVGEAFEVSVKSSISGNIQVNFPVEFVSGGSMSGMSQQITNSSRSIIYYKTEMGFLQKEGEFTFGPAKIRSGNKIYTSNKVTVRVAKLGNQPQSKNIPSTKNLSDQIAFGLIETSKPSVYVGEPVLINARVYAQFEPKSFEDYKEYQSKGLPDKHKIPNPDITNVELKNYQNKRFYSFLYDKSVCFPAESGTFSIQPFELTLGNFFDQEKVVSESAAIVVKPLPGDKPASFNGSVGKINMERIIKKGANKQGDVAIVSYVFSGYGNIHSIEIPEMNLPGSIQLYGDPIIREDFQFTEKGAEGKLTIDFNLQMLDPGNLMIPTFEFSYFDLEQEKYQSIRVDSILFNIEKTPGFDRKKAQEDANKRLTKKKNNSENSQSWIAKNSIWLFSSLGLSVLCAILFLFFKNKKSNRIIEAQDKLNNLNEVRYDPQVTNFKYNINLEKLENLVDSPSEYIKQLSSELEKWLNSFDTGNDYLAKSKIEKFEILAQQELWRDKIESIKELFRKVDEVRYGLPADSFFCKNLQIKVQELLKS